MLLDRRSWPSEISIMDDGGIDENTTVPHPSIHPTITQGYCNLENTAHQTSFASSSQVPNIYGTSLTCWPENSHYQQHQQQQQQQQQPPHHPAYSEQTFAQYDLQQQHPTPPHLVNQLEQPSQDYLNQQHQMQQQQHLYPLQHQQQFQPQSHQQHLYANLHSQHQHQHAQQPPQQPHHHHLQQPQELMQQQQQCELSHQNHHPQPQHLDQHSIHRQHQQTQLQLHSSKLTSPSGSCQQIHEQLVQKLRALVQRSILNGEKLKVLCQLQEEFVLRSQDHNTVYSKKRFFESNQDYDNAHRLDKEIKLSQTVLQGMANELKDKKSGLWHEFSKLFHEVSIVQSEVLFEHLPDWRLKQQLALNGSSVSSFDLDQMQQWCEMITDVVWRTRNQLRAFHIFLKNVGCTEAAFHDVNQLGMAINRSIETLVLNTFVVEKQPPQVMKTNTRSTATVRLLSGSKLNISLINPTIKVDIISESNARTIKQKHKELIESSWAVLNSVIENSSDKLSTGIAGSTVSSSLNAPASNQSTQMQVDYSNSPADSVSSPNGQASIMNYPTMTGPPIVSSSNSHLPQQSHLTGSKQIAPLKVGSSKSSPPNQVADIRFNKNKILNMKNFEPSGEILNSSNLLEYNEQTRQVSCCFRSLQLRKIKRPEKKGTESVTDEKSILLFHSQFRIADLSSGDCGSGLSMCSNATLPWMNQGDMTFHLMAFSLPVVVIVHGNQEPHAWATITWHNAFARADDILYKVPDTVSWQELGQVLSDKFRTSAGKGLSPSNIDYLGSKVCQTHSDKEIKLVTWNQFSKEPLPDRTFTFWEWFHSVLKLTKEHLKSLWVADRIYGFVGKKGSANLLAGNSLHESRSVGTFLLRYSDSELGGITVAWVASPTSNQGVNRNGCIQISKRSSPTNTSPYVLQHLRPLINKDLGTRSLADRIRDSKELKYLYPDIPKDEAFKDFYTPLNITSPSRDEYIRPILIQTLVTDYPVNLLLDESSAAASTTTNTAPATPNSYSMSPNENMYQEEGCIETEQMS